MQRVPLILISTVLLSGLAHGADVTSISRIAFGPNNVLMVADWKSGKIHALALGPAEKAPAKPLNLTSFSKDLDKVFGTHEVAVEDVKVRPGTSEVYVAVSTGSTQAPGIAVVDAAGVTKRLDLKAAHATSVAIKDAPDADFKFWGQLPERSFTVTDMKWHDGKLYASGLSNQSFASTLRVIDYPFTGKQSVTSIEMYHTSHNQNETRAPIRTMTFVSLDGKDTLLAAYLCTPLVTVPVSELKDGAHVTGKTIAELGYGNTPVDLLAFEAKDDAGKLQQYVLLTNVNRNAETIPLASIVAANTKPGLSKPVSWSKTEGVDVIDSPISDSLRIDSLDDQFFVTMRRNMKSGELQLVTVAKQFKLRISDFVSEYNFPSYTYPPGMQTEYIKPITDGLMREEGFSAPITKGR